MNNYVYILDGKAYVNLTNKCHNACSFCIRNTGNGVAGTPLWLDNEPTAAEVVAAFDKLGYTGEEIVFCGYGEPTENLSALIGSAREFKRRGYRTRLNTNGLGNLVNGMDITGELGCIDTVSVSLNNHTAEKYAEITKSAFGLRAFDAVLGFAKACKAAGSNVVFTVVDVIGDDDVKCCKQLCDGMDIPLRVRKYVADNYGDGTTGINAKGD